MLVLTFISASGGVGKTMLAINTAARLAIDGHKVLFIDFDPSMTATRVLLGNTISDYNLQTLMKKMIDKKKGRSGGSIDVDDYIRIHKIPGAPGHEIRVLPGGNIYEISADIMVLPEWGRLLSEIVDMVMEKYNYEPTVIVDSPNWVYEFFEMTMYLHGSYVAMTRPGRHEIIKFREFLSSISKLLSSNNVKPEDTVTYVVNQYRSNMSADLIMREWSEIEKSVREVSPNISPLIDKEHPDCYYGKTKTPFVGFKMRDDLSIDNYISEGPIFLRRHTRSRGECEDRDAVIKQFDAYYKALINFVKIYATG